MSVKRSKDPARLLGDRITVDFTDPRPSDIGATYQLLASASPQARIDRLRRHQELTKLADTLCEKLKHLHGKANHALLTAIAGAEATALYLDASPAVIEKQRRSAAASALSDSDILAAVIKHSKKKDAAAELGLTDRQLRNRLRAIGNRKS